MATAHNTQPSSPTNSALRLPAARRISTPASLRLTAITENPGANPGARPGAIENADVPPIPPRSSLRLSASAYAPEYRPQSDSTTRTGPPAYQWIPDDIDGDEDLTAPVEGEKLAQLRRAGPPTRRRDRGGWGRLALIAGVILVLIIGLAVGLGVGLTVGKNGDGKNRKSSQPATGATNMEQAKQFPLGEYSLVTALRNVDTNCTSNAAAWTCLPYTTYNSSDSSTFTASLATFNWIITSTTSQYASNDTSLTTSDNGVPSNLTISSTDNPFGTTFTNQTLTYINTDGNSTSAKYTFTFEMIKTVIPSADITSSGAASQCFFNSTTFTGTLYLSAPGTLLNESQTSSPGVGGYTLWPYAVDVVQQSPGGENVPACYEMVNGDVGARILTAVTPQSEESSCICDYRNY